MTDNNSLQATVAAIFLKLRKLVVEALCSPLPWIVLWFAVPLSPFPSNDFWDNTLQAGDLYPSFGLYPSINLNPLLSSPSSVLWSVSTLLLCLYIGRTLYVSFIMRKSGDGNAPPKWIQSVFGICTVLTLLYLVGYFVYFKFGRTAEYQGVSRKFLEYDAYFAFNALLLGLTIVAGRKVLEWLGPAAEAPVALSQSDFLASRNFTIFVCALFSLWFSMGTLVYPWIRNV